MANIENQLQNAFEKEPEVTFNTSDDELFKRAQTTANINQGSNDIIGLGIASLWVVLAGLFMTILKPILKNMAKDGSK